MTTTPTTPSIVDIWQCQQRRYLSQKWVENPNLIELDTPAETLATYIEMSADDPPDYPHVYEKIKAAMIEQRKRVRR